MNIKEQVLLSHGSGREHRTLLREIILPSLMLESEQHRILEDAAILGPVRGKIAFTTDSFVVNPLQFNGGDIGKLAACGTINDLAMMGARPIYISVGLIIEEGISFTELKTVLASLRKECENAEVSITCGDTKVVNAGNGDGLFINTSGIGSIISNTSLSAANACEGDAVIVSGPIGQHGIVILTARNKLDFSTDVVSDCASLHNIALHLLDEVPQTRVLRDATRGGCAAVLNEIAYDSKVTITLNEEDIPVLPSVKSACEYLGFDVLHVANEGRFVAIVPHEMADKAISVLKRDELGRDSAVIGSVGKYNRFGLLLRTQIGGIRPVETPSGQLLPRIC